MKCVQLTARAALLGSLLFLVQIFEVSAQEVDTVPCELAYSEGWIEGEQCFYLWESDEDEVTALEGWTEQFRDNACESAFTNTTVVNCDQVPENVGLGCTPKGDPVEAPCESGGKTSFQSTDEGSFTRKCETYMQSTGMTKEQAEIDCSAAWNASRRTGFRVSFVCIEYFAKHAEFQRCERIVVEKEEHTRREDY